MWSGVSITNEIGEEEEENGGGEGRVESVCLFVVMEGCDCDCFGGYIFFSGRVFFGRGM